LGTTNRGAGLVVLVSLLAWLGLPAQALADDSGHNRFSVGPRMVFYRPTDADHGRWSPGGQIRLPVGPEYSLEVSVDAVRYTSQGANITVKPVQLTLIGYFAPQANASPYLLVGAGWYSPEADGPYVNPHRRFGPHVGAGLQAVISDRLTIDGSYRFLWTQVNSLTQPLYAFGRHFRERGSMFTAALNYRFR
jgi:opacity protein-like surface antigen